MSAMPNNPLGRLINETQAARGYSDGDVEKWANRDGVRRITTKDLSAWRRAGMATLVPDKVTALADGLRLPVTVVVTAALHGMGIELDLAPATPEDAIRADHTLTTDTRDILLTILSTARASERPQRPRRIKRDTDPSQQL